MPITCQDFMNAAQNMINGDKSEIDFRNSASRAYYAAYHTAIQFGSTRRTENPTGGVHQQLINDLANNKDQKIREIGELLKQCKAARTIADYKLSKNFNRHRAETAIGIANELLRISVQ